MTASTSPRRWPGLPAVLSEAPFRSLLISQGIFDLGAFMRIAAQSWVVFELTDSQLWVGAAAGARAAPTVLLAVAGGVLADRLSRRALLWWSMLWMAGLVAIVALITSTDTAQAWHYVLLAAGIGLGASVHQPSFYALVADLVHPANLSRANGMVAMVSTAGEMAGPLLVGVLIAASGAGTVFWLVAAGYVTAALLVLRVREPERRRPSTLRQVPISSGSRQSRDSDDAAGSGRQGQGSAALAELRAGLAYVWKTQPLPWLVLLVMAQNLLAVAIFPLLPVYAEEVLDVGATGYGVMGAMIGAGLLVSAAIVAVFGTYHRGSLVMLISGMVWDGCMVGFGFSRIYPLSLALLFFLGLSGVIWVNAVLTMFQKVASDEMRGRVMSLYVLSMEMFPIGWLYGGAVAEWLGNEEALIISALCGTPLILLALALSPQLRRA